MRAILAATALAALVMTGCGGDSETGGPTTTLPATSTSTGDASATTGTTHPPAAGFVVETDYVGEGPRVAVLGDSLAVQSRDALRSALPDHALRIAAVRGEGFATGGYSTEFGQPLMLTAAADIGATDPDVAVIALGTNDAWTPDGTLPDALDALDEIVADLGEACIVAVLVDPDPPASDFDVDAAATINARLQDVGDQVVDWGAIADEDGVRGDDGIHPTADGQRRWAEGVAAAVEACSASG